MNGETIDIRPAEVVANIEQRTDSELISIIKETLTAVATGYPIESVNEHYKLIYDELSGRLASQSIVNPNEFEDLWAFYDYWNANGLDTYASRRSFVRGLYRTQQSPGSTPNDIWSSLHPVIVGVAKTRFDSGHYADAVEAPFKEINSRIKEEVRQRTGKVYDGADLMNNAFSVNKPIIVLENLESEDGLNIQKGYMMMFAGAMTAIRNPKAHSNDSIEPGEAMPLIQLASHLFTKFDMATKRDKENEVSEKSKDVTPGVYVRIRDPDNSEKLLKLKRASVSHPGGKAIILVLGEAKRSAIRLPFTVDGSKGFEKELKSFLGEDSVVIR